MELVIQPFIFYQCRPCMVDVSLIKLFILNLSVIIKSELICIMWFRPVSVSVHLEFRIVPKAVKEIYVFLGFGLLNWFILISVSFAIDEFLFIGIAYFHLGRYGV